MKMPNLQMYVAVLALAALTACAQLGLPQPETFNEKLTVGYGTVTEVRTTATALLTAGKISSTDAENVQTSANVARAGLDVARDLSKTNMTAAEGKVNAVRTGLNAVLAYLATRK